MSWWGQACSLAVLCRKKVYIYRSVFNIIKIDIKFFVKISPFFFCIISHIYSNEKNFQKGSKFKPTRVQVKVLQGTLPLTLT